MSATCEFQSITRTVESPPWWKESKQCQCGSKIEVVTVVQTATNLNRENFKLKGKLNFISFVSFNFRLTNFLNSIIWQMCVIALSYH